MPTPTPFNRRTFLGTAAASILTAETALMENASANAGPAPGKTGASAFRFSPIKQVRAGVLDVGYYEAGPSDGPPVILLHGFPYSGLSPLPSGAGA